MCMGLANAAGNTLGAIGKPLGLEKYGKELGGVVDFVGNPVLKQGTEIMSQGRKQMEKLMPSIPSPPALQGPQQTETRAARQGSALLN